jgi:predicted metal-dependent enzyme (double-stranded beta helix superfamily)
MTAWPAHDRDLTTDELEQVAAAVAAQSGLWAAHVHHDPEARVYERLHLDDHLEVWLICWMRDQDTGFHDHDVSAGAVAVAGGRVREERLVLGGGAQSREAGAGATFSFEASDIHRVLHAGDAPAVTIHAYSPPLRRMGAYEVGEDGRLRRWSVPSEDELRPVAGVAWDP